MKFLLDMAPIVAFWLGYVLAPADLDAFYFATAVAMAACLVQVVGFRLWSGRFEPMHLWVLGLVLVLGGATLLMQDKWLFKLKPTLVNWLFALVFFGSEYIGKRNLVERLMGQAVELPAWAWRRLNLAWAGFFVFTGAVNVFVAYRFSEQAWVNFKLFGSLAMTLLFVLANTLYLMHLLAVSRRRQVIEVADETAD